MACDNGGCSNSCLNTSETCGCGGDCFTCSSNCGDACKNGCKGSCGGCGGCSGCGGCDNSCYGTCDTTCKTGCYNSCKNTCTACTGECSGTCDNGCKGEELTQIYTNLVLNKYIKSIDIKDLNKLITNEMSRRNLTPFNIDGIEQGDLANFSTIDSIYDNLMLMSNELTTSLNEPELGLILKELTESYISAVKKLYEADLKP